MESITVHISDPVYHELQEFARQTDRNPEEVVQEAIELYRQERIHPAKTMSILDVKPLLLGKVLKPWSTRSELLEDFFERDEQN